MRMYDVMLMNENNGCYAEVHLLAKTAEEAWLKGIESDTCGRKPFGAIVKGYTAQNGNYHLNYGRHGVK